MTPKKKPVEPHAHKAARTIELCACGASRLDRGEWRPPKDLWAMVRSLKGIVALTPKKIREKAQKAAEGRWRMSTPVQRSEFAQYIGKFPRPSRQVPVEMKCPCGLMTLARAAKRKHVCFAGQAPLLEEIANLRSEQRQLKEQKAEERRERNRLWAQENAPRLERERRERRGDD